MRFAGLLAVLATLLPHMACSAELTVTAATLRLPAEWRVLSRTTNRAVAESSSRDQRVTLSTLQVEARASIQVLQKLVHHRIEAEKSAAPDVFVEPEEPFRDGSQYVTFFSGGERSTGRLFSCYMVLTESTLTTVYLESIALDAKQHLSDFQSLVNGAKTLRDSK